MSAEHTPEPDTLLLAMGRAAQCDPRRRVFDWDEAARRIVAAGATEASAGLGEDWENTEGAILSAGKPIPEEETYFFLASDWATPELDLGHGRDPCWIFQRDSPGWGAKTYWPKSARDILAADNKEVSA